MSRRSRKAEQHGELFPTSSVEAFPVKIYPWLESVLALLESEAGCSGSSCELSAISLPAGFLSKTSMGFSVPTKDGICPPSSGRWLSAGMGGPTVCSTLNISVWPSGGIVCSLSDVLETCDVPHKYYLSPKACRGILRRAAKRGKTLPLHLEAALTQAAMNQETK